MLSYWADYINVFKAAVLLGNKQLGQRRLAILQPQLDCLWQNLTLRQMQPILVIDNDYTVNFLMLQLLQPYLSTRKVIYQAYIVSQCHEQHQDSLMYIYDCKIFRSSHYSKEQNQFVSSFLLVYKQNVEISQPVYEVVDCGNLPACRWALKVKESAILRVYAYLKEVMRKVAQRSDKIVLGEDKYTAYMEEWMKCYYNYNIDITTNYFFKGVLALLQNQLLLHYICTLTPPQLHERMFCRPIKTIEKPKNVEQFTFTQGILQTETKWQTLKITAYRLKYRVEETTHEYQCFRVDEPEQEFSQEEIVSEEDAAILQAFALVHSADQDYDTMYY